MVIDDGAVIMGRLVGPSGMGLKGMENMLNDKGRGITSVKEGLD